MTVPADVATTKHDRYRGVLRVLFASAMAGAIGGLGAAAVAPAAALLDGVVVLGLSACVIAAVAFARAIERVEVPPESVAIEPAAAVEPAATEAATEGAPVTPAPSKPPPPPTPAADLETLRNWIGAGGLVALVLEHVWIFSAVRRATPAATVAVVIACVVAAASAALVARYLGSIEPQQLPEGAPLARGARVAAWLLVLTAIEVVAARVGLSTLFYIAHLAAAVVIASTCVGLLRSRIDPVHPRFPVELAVPSVLGARANVVASVLDAGERQLGIDLRSTWALTVVRRSVLPLALGLAVLAWLSTAISIVPSNERALLERFGVPAEGSVLSPGIHVHWPWPIDRVLQIPVQRVRSLTVGHEGEEKGPENVLWAQQHAANEYTLLLGNGRDLITVDATVQFRIVDARAWAYSCSNPSDALRAIAYRAVMRATVDRTLADALSENVATLTKGMREAVQHDANELGLGVEIVDFTIGGMHPPVPVANAYQAVVSAELGKITASVQARAERNRVIPAAEADADSAANTASAEAAERRARAAGEAWSFRALEAQYNTAPDEYRFRRRLETLETWLAGRAVTIVDDRIMKDGGGLWLKP
ncbi:MAG TPA: SPFH domain-containing protein [Kofleriaceae bacterium]|nr:SPFH domain-containing protein [Kofleriaceae bacterium]